MPEYDNKNSGVLFKNSRKTEDKHPDYTGTYTDGDGNEFFLSAWIKTAKNGAKFMSLSTKPKTDKPQSAPKQAADAGEPF